MKSKIKKIVEYIICFVLTICIVGLSIIMIFSSTILNKAYIKNKMTQTKYYDKIYNEVLSNIQNYIGPSGLEEEDFEGIVTRKKVEEDTDIILDNIYSGIIEEVNTDEIRGNLENKLQSIYSQRTIENNSKTKNKKTSSNLEQINTQKNQESIDVYINKISNTYTSTVLHTNYEKNINKVMTKIIKLINISKKVFVCIIAVFMIILLAINYKSIFKGFSSMAIPMLASGIFLEIINLFIKFKINIENILILNEAISKVIQSVINSILYKFERYGLIMIGAGIVVIIIGNIIDNYNKETENY